MLEKEFVTYEIAKQLKDLGFDKKCLATYDYKQFIIMDYQSGEDYDINYAQDCDDIFDYLAPLYQQVIDWFVVKYGIWVIIDTTLIKFYKNDILKPPKFQFVIEDLINRDNDYLFHSGDEELYYFDHKEAREAGILRVIEIIKNENISKRN